MKQLRAIMRLLASDCHCRDVSSALMWSIVDVEWCFAGRPIQGLWPNTKCWFGSCVIFQGIRISIDKKTYIFVIFQGGGGPYPMFPLL